MKFLDAEPTTKDFPKTAPQEAQKFRIAFGLGPNGQVGFALWKVGFAIGPIYSGSIDDPDLATAQLIQAIAASKKEANE